MAADAARWVWKHSRAANGSLIVLLAIADECGNGREVEMSVTAIARKSRLSDRAVRTAIKDLERLGELSVAPHRGGVSRYALAATPAISSGPPRQNLPDPPAISSGPAESAPRQNLPDPPEKPQVRATPAESAGPEISNVFNRSTGIQVAEVKETPATPRADVDRLCEHLASCIEANGSKRPRITKRWRDSCRRMIDIDGRTEKQIRDAIDWCQGNEFWQANILSMPKLREKYETLRIQATNERKPRQAKTTTADRARQAIEAGRELSVILNGGIS